MTTERISSLQPDALPPTYISIRGARALCLACLHSSVGIEFLSIAGSGTAVQAVLSAVVAGQEVEIGPEDRPVQAIRLRSFTGNKGFRAMVRRLPSGFAHGIAITRRSIPEGNGRTFVLLAKGTDTESAATALLNMLDRRTGLPIHPSWSEWLWRTAAKKGWLSPLDGFGPYSGWEVDIDEEELKEVLSTAIKKGTLTIAEGP